MAGPYVEHGRMPEGLGLEVVDCTVGDYDMGRLVWVGSDGMNGRWMSHDDFRALAAAVAAFAAQLPPGERKAAE